MTLSGQAPLTWSGAGALTQLRVLTARQVRSTYGDRRLVVFSLLQPLIMLLLLSQIFGSLANPGDFPNGVRYIDYLVPALLVTTGIGSAQAAGVGLVRDMDNGIVARFRVLPTRLSLVLVARSLSDLLRVLVELLATLACGYLFFGFRPGGGVGGTLAALLLTLVVIWSLIWCFLALAAWLRSIEVMSSVAVLLIFPLMFASSAFVPLQALPAWLRTVARCNPVTYAVDGARNLALGWPAGGGVTAAVAISLALTAAAFIMAAVCFRSSRL